MAKTLHLAPGLTVPIDIATQKTAILGMTGSGKSYCMTKLAELFLDNHVQVVFIDPKGETWGLRLMADGKTPAYSIPVFGGQHADLPLRPDMGRRIAELLVNGDYSAVLDVSEFISSELAQFGYDFATRLFELKKQKPGAMNLMIDEAQDFIPQNPNERGMEPKMLAAFERVGKQLRSKGVGMVIAGQRPQEINKKVLNMCECWFAFQMTGLQERDTMEKIFRDKDREEAKRMSELLPKLEVGNAHVWSPRLLKVSADYKIAEKKTFDSSSTPTVGSRRVVPRKLSPVDVNAITVSMNDLLEKQKANDPIALQKKVNELSAELRKKAKPTIDQDAIDKILASTAGAIHRDYGKLLTSMKKSLVVIQTALKTQSGFVDDVIYNIEQKLEAVKLGETPAKVTVTHTPGPARITIPKQDPDQVFFPGADDGSLTGVETRILRALAELSSIGVVEASLVQVAALADYSNTRSKGFQNARSAMKSKGWIDYPTQGTIALTEAGKRVAPAVDELLSSESLQRKVIDLIGGACGRILQPLIESYPESIDKLELAGIAGYTNPRSKGFQNAMSRLSSLGFAEYPTKGAARATKLLFLE